MNGDRFFLEEVGTITKAEVLRKKEVQINTRIHYAQKRCAEHEIPACLRACSPWHSMTCRSQFNGRMLQVCRVTVSMRCLMNSRSSCMHAGSRHC